MRDLMLYQIPDHLKMLEAIWLLYIKFKIYMKVWALS